MKNINYITISFVFRDRKNLVISISVIRGGSVGSVAITDRIVGRITAVVARVSGRRVATVTTAVAIVLGYSRSQSQDCEENELVKKNIDMYTCTYYYEVYDPPKLDLLFVRSEQ